MKSCICLSIVLSLFVFHCFTQDIDQNLIGTSGDLYENGTTSLSWTLGETMIETMKSGSVILNQGFQQGILIVTSIKEDTEINSFLKIYPNPVDYLLNIESQKTGLSIQLLNIYGQVLFNGKLEDQFVQIDLRTLPVGTYILKINSHKTQKVVKQK